jgi:hypothetical protein
MTLLPDCLPAFGCLAIGGSLVPLIEPCNKTLALDRRLLAAGFTAFRGHLGSLKLRLPAPPRLSLSGMRFCGQV